MVTSVCLQTPLTELYNDLGDVVRLFFGEVSVSAEKGDLCIVHSMDELGHLVRIGECSARRPLTPACSDPLLEKRLCKRAAKSCLYDALKAYTGQKPPWGSLTGIRPTRLFFEQLEQGKSMEEAERALCKTFDLDADKASLLRQIAQVQRALSMPKPGDIDVYVGIPFCTTRCTYCSFAATDLKHGGPLVDPYVEAVQREMRLCAPSLAGYRVRCIYIGGGTPTALRVEQLAHRERLIHWGPRTLDLDILLYDDEVFETDTLIVPHVEMQLRDFVLRPMAEIAPNLRHPVLKKTMTELLRALTD